MNEAANFIATFGGAAAGAAASVWFFLGHVVARLDKDIGRCEGAAKEAHNRITQHMEMHHSK